MPEDARLIIRALDKGYTRIHIRKPNATDEQVADIIEQIPLSYRKRISIHYQLDLAVVYGLGGIHLNSRNHIIPPGFKGLVSRSCHSLDEIKQYKDACDYLFLSPIYDSISKKGYKSGFDADVLAKAGQEGIIDCKVCALGGVTPARLSELEELGFGGAAMLGCVWDELETPPIVLTIAGSDCSGGAGIQADIKTISALGCYAASVITAVTSQNTLGVRQVEQVSPDMVRSQLSAVFDDLNVSAIKIGMIHETATAKAITDILRLHPEIPVICDPVMVSTSGTVLMNEECRNYIEKELFPLCTLITPNLHETSVLIGHRTEIRTASQMEEAAATLSAKYGCAVLIKGGHLEGDNMIDILYDGTIHKFTTEKIISRNLHGTGCTLSSAIASYLALLQGNSHSRLNQGNNHNNHNTHNNHNAGQMRQYAAALPEAVQAGKSYTRSAISNASRMEIGHGNGPLWHF